MYEVPFSVAESLEDYQQLISNYSAFLYILIAMLLFGFLIYQNRKTKISLAFMILFTVIFSILFFSCRKGEMFKEIYTIFHMNFYKNIYFYYWNTFFTFILIAYKLWKEKEEKKHTILLLLFFILLSTNSIFQFYINAVMKNDIVMVLGNTGPMIIVGNFISFAFYIYLLLNFLVRRVRKKC